MTLPNNPHHLSTSWRHKMEIFSALLALCVGNSPVTDEFPSQRPVTRSFGVSFDLRLNKRFSKQSWGWCFETPSRPLWRHSYDTMQRCSTTGMVQQGCCYSHIHGDVIKWKHFPRHWPFVWGIHRSPVNSPHKGQSRGALMLSSICALNKRLGKQ